MPRRWRGPKRTDLAERRAKELAATAQAKEIELQVLRPLAEGLPRKNSRRYGALPKICGPKRPNARSRSAG